MILGANHLAIAEAGVVFLIALCVGVMYILLYFLRLCSQNKILGFIFDLVYAIILGGIFVLAMIRINMCDIKYYHVLAWIIGLYLSGLLPVHFIRKREKVIVDFITCGKRRVRNSRIYAIITKGNNDRNN